MQAFLKNHYTQDLRLTDDFALSNKNLNRRFWKADRPLNWAGAQENEKNPCFGTFRAHAGYG
jgi:hypothetical protein